jgi:hypothetical protein
MKKMGLWLLAAMALLQSCSTEIDVTADWEERTIVYSIVNKTDLQHYIRIHKAFLDPNTSALLQAGIKDSLYFQNLSVEINEIKNGAVLRTFTCEEVDTNLIEPGIFAFPDQVLYRFTTPNGMDSTAEYRLNIVTPGGQVVRSSLFPIGGFSITSFNTSIPPNTPFLPVNFTGLNWSNPAALRVAFRAPRNAKNWNLTVRIIYNEWPTGNIGDSVRKFIDYPAVRNRPFNTVNANEAVEYRMFGRDLFSFMASTIPVNTNVQRRMRGTIFILTFVDEPLTNFLTLNTSSSSATDIRPEFTNIENGLGIFGTTYEIPKRSDLATADPYTNFGYRAVEGGRGTDSLRARYPQLNFVP